MAFNADAFGSATLAPRTKDVSVPELADWFADGDAPVFRVRGLTADELAQAKDAHANNLRRQGLLEALERAEPGKIAEETKAIIGATAKDKHAQVAMRQEMVRWGLVEPELSEEVIAKLARHYALALYRLSDAINDLTGQGSEAAKKPKRSSRTATSDPASA